MKENKYYLVYNNAGVLRNIGIIQSGQLCSDNDITHKGQRLFITLFLKTDIMSNTFISESDNWFVDVKNKNFKKSKEKEFKLNKNLTVLDPLGTNGLSFKECLGLLQMITTYIEFKLNGEKIELDDAIELIIAILDSSDEEFCFYSIEEFIKDKLMKFPLMKEKR